MEGDEMEMSKEELQRLIREKVKSKLMSTDVQERCNQLQSLLDRREKQAVQLLKLCESVAACEAIVKKQYSQLGWEYRDTDSDDGDNVTGCANKPPSSCESTNGHICLRPKPQDRESLDRDAVKKSSVCLKRKPVVVLTKLPMCKIRSLRPPTPQNRRSEDESSNNSVSDMQWEPEDDSSDYSFSSHNTGSNKRRKTDQRNEKLAKRHVTPQASGNTGAKVNTAKTSKPQASTNAHAKSNETKTSEPPANTKGVAPACIISKLCQSTHEATKSHPSAPQREISVNMSILARRKAMSWRLGEIVEIVRKEDGRLKYKIGFEGKTKILVSGHHIAFDCMPKLKELFVGARVVVKCQAERTRFCSGVLAELPSRKNRMRFLVFIDDQTAVYVGLPLLHLVCRPLTDPSDDIPDITHKNFIKEYLKAWPFPPQTQYRIGQTINAEFHGVQQRCEVLMVDSSLVQVVCQKDQRKEWLYRGSLRLEHMINMKEHLDLKRDGAEDKTQWIIKIGTPMGR